jgi:hypothetical protein
MQKKLGKLRLHRETLQILATPQLRTIAGGTISGTTVSANVTNCYQCTMDLPPTYSCDGPCGP